MQKTSIFCESSSMRVYLSPHWIKLMRISALVIANVVLVTHLLIAGPGIGQTTSEKLIDLHCQNTVLKKIFRIIEEKAGVDVMYKLTDKIINEKVSISVSQTP